MNSAVLGIDPGNRETAYCVWDGSQIGEAGKVDNFTFDNQIPELLRKHNVEEAGIELVANFGFTAGETLFETEFWAGWFAKTLKYGGLNFLPIYRKKVVTHHVGHARGKDTDVRSALIRRLGAPGTKKQPGPTYGIVADMWSALAIATYIYDKHQPTIEVRVHQSASGLRHD